MHIHAYVHADVYTCTHIISRPTYMYTCMQICMLLSCIEKQNRLKRPAGYVNTHNDHGYMQTHKQEQMLGKIVIITRNTKKSR